MDKIKLQKQIEDIWQQNEFSSANKLTILEAISALDEGLIRPVDANNNAEEWVKKAILLYFKIQQAQVFEMENHSCYDKIPLKTSGWKEHDFTAHGFRMVPGAIVRHGAFIGKNAVIMPSFINIGAYVGEGTMVDTWATIGSCAQIGKNCHISGGAGIGGVLEPLQAAPVIIGDNCFIGARSEVAEGVTIGNGSVLAMGVFLAASTKIYNQMTGEITYGAIPPNSVVVPGAILDKNGVSKYAAIIIKQVDAKTLSKTQINEILRND